MISWLQFFIQNHIKIDHASSSSFENDDSGGEGGDAAATAGGPPIGSQLLAYVIVAILGFGATDYLIPVIKVSD